jgi:hypothetical protein
MLRKARIYGIVIASRYDSGSILTLVESLFLLLLGLFKDNCFKKFGTSVLLK